MRSCVILVVDEASWAGDKKAEAVLKALITESVLTLEPKHVDSMQWPNNLHIIILANEDWIGPAGEDERRYVKSDVSDRYANNKCPSEKRNKYFSALEDEIEHGGLEAMLYELLHWDLKDWHPRNTPADDGLRDQKRFSLMALDQWLELTLQDGRLPGNGTYAGHPRSRSLSDIRDNIRVRVSLHDERFINHVQLSMYLKKQGIFKHETAEANLWRFPPLKQMRADWERRFGGWTWDSNIKNWLNEDDMWNKKGAAPGGLNMGNIDTRLRDLFKPVR